MKVLVIGGGVSDEREVSLRSSSAVLRAAIAAGHETDFYDWDGSENWLMDNVSNFEVVLPIIHGAGGEDGVIQKLLESQNVRFLGSDSKVSELCFDKEKTREFLKSHGFKLPEGRLVTINEYSASDLSNKPHVLKPFNGGSSLDTFIFPNMPSQNDLNAIKQAFQRHDTLLLEEYISGIEITVPILDNIELPVIEIIPPENGVFDYENKYNGQTQEIVPPINIGVGMQKTARQQGLKIHTLMGCRHLSRVDMIVSKNGIYTLEINTMPGMTDQSLFPKAAKFTGLEFPAFVSYLIKLVSEGEI